MKGLGIYKKVMLFLFLVYLALYISQSSGYYDYTSYQKMVITSDAMQRFEEDLKEGKDVLMIDYMEVSLNDYSNDLSDYFLSISKSIDKYVGKIVIYILEGINSMITTS